MRKEPFFSKVRLRTEDLDPARFPLSIPAVRDFEKVRFHPAITYFVGENAAGKSTLIEAIAQAAGFNAEGGTKNFVTDSGGSTDLKLADAMSLVRGPEREKDGFFLRAESAYVLASYISEVEKGHPPAYGGNLHHVSHGESFMQIFRARFDSAKNCLFILDEVESALSPQRQLEFLALMNMHIGRGSMFIISTHSPILMAHPSSRLYWLDENGLDERSWKDTEHFRVYEAWMKRPEIMLDILLEEQGACAI